MTREHFFSLEITLFISPTYFYLHISLFQCCGVFLFIFHVKNYGLRFFLIFFGDFSCFDLDILDCLSYSSLPAVAIPEYIYKSFHLCFSIFYFLSLFLFFKFSCPLLPFPLSLPSPLSLFSLSFIFPFFFYSFFFRQVS